MVNLYGHKWAQIASEMPGRKGKNIRAVFMEEINSDMQALDDEQNIRDRHFVAFSYLYIFLLSHLDHRIHQN